jgi:hypothetical protein
VTTSTENIEAPANSCAIEIFFMASASLRNYPATSRHRTISLSRTGATPARNVLRSGDAGGERSLWYGITRLYLELDFLQHHRLWFRESERLEVAVQFVIGDYLYSTTVRLQL